MRTVIKIGGACWHRETLERLTYLGGRGKYGAMVQRQDGSRQLVRPTVLARRPPMRRFIKSDLVELCVDAAQQLWLAGIVITSVPLVVQVTAGDPVWQGARVRPVADEMAVRPR